MGIVLGTLADLGYGWAYRVLDAQYFGVAQRRRRVFIVGHLGDAARAASVLFEPESGSGGPPPSREARKVVAALSSSGAGTERTGNERTEADMMVVGEIAAPLIASADKTGHTTDANVVAALTQTLGSGGADDNKAQAGHIIAFRWAQSSTQYAVPKVDVTDSIKASNSGEPAVAYQCHGSNVGDALAASYAKHGGDSAPHNMVVRAINVRHMTDDGDVTQALAAKSSGGYPLHYQSVIAFTSKDHGQDAAEEVSPTLRAMGHDASHMNGGGQVAVAVPFVKTARPRSPEEAEKWEEGDVSPTLNSFDVGEKRAHTLAVIQDVRGGTRDRADQGQGIGIRECDGPMYTLSVTEQHAVAFAERSRAEGRTLETQDELAYALTDASKGGNPHSGKIATEGLVRRLTPLECERLMGFPDGWTALSDAVDSPRYRALGNAVVVSVTEWIGRRIARIVREVWG